MELKNGLMTIKHSKQYYERTNERVRDKKEISEEEPKYEKIDEEQR